MSRGPWVDQDRSIPAIRETAYSSYFIDGGSLTSSEDMTDRILIFCYLDFS